MAGKIGQATLAIAARVMGTIALFLLAFSFAAASAKADLMILSVPGSPSTGAVAINNAGVVLGQYASNHS